MCIQEVPWQVDLQKPTGSAVSQLVVCVLLTEQFKYPGCLLTSMKGYLKMSKEKAAMAGACKDDRVFKSHWQPQDKCPVLD